GGEYVVMPAHMSGAARAGSSPFGTRSTYRSSTTMFAEYPPYVQVFLPCSRLPNVNVTPFSQNISWPARHSGHARHESTMQPTPTRSPSRKRDAPALRDTTRPMISWPGTTGKFVFPQSSFTLCTSL